MARQLAFALFVLGLGLGTGASAGSFARYHPDQHYFALGMREFQAQRHAPSLAHFRRAARYGDKPSQLAVAMMLHDGVGTSPDRALAYVWADLAAERGYPAFLRVRERIWEALDARQRADALQQGPALYAEYGDAVAKPRLESLLERGLAGKTGSRAGGHGAEPGVIELAGGAQAAFMATFLIRGAQPGGEMQQLFALTEGTRGAAAAPANALRAGSYYDDANWRPEAYWAARDAQWRQVGTVTVAPLQPATEQPR